MLNENKISQIHLDNASYRPNHRMRTVCVITEIQHSVEKIAINTSTFLTNTDTFNTNDCQYQYWQYPQYRTMPKLSVPMPTIPQYRPKSIQSKTNTGQNRYYQTPRALLLVHV